jgi:hypothetical protein
VLRTTSRNTGAIGVDKIAIVTNAARSVAAQAKWRKGLEVSGLFGGRVRLDRGGQPHREVVRDRQGLSLI